MTPEAVPLPLLRRGKVRDVYVVDDARLLLVASDRVSAFDVIMEETVPFKGAVLTQLTAWWLSQLDDSQPHHMISADAGVIVADVPALAPAAAYLADRSMLCHRTEVYPVECVVRGYLCGSALREYRNSGTLAGEPLPPGLQECGALDAPRFSPATKAESGHDENIPVAEVARQLGAALAAELEERSLELYQWGAHHAAEAGILLADTKFEFGRAADGRVLLIDEVLTPDSSRFWPADGYAPGRSQPSFDKQPLRDYLDAERAAGRWNGDAPPPRLPNDLLSGMTERYLDAFARLTGRPLSPTSP